MLFLKTNRANLDLDASTSNWPTLILHHMRLRFDCNQVFYSLLIANKVHTKNVWLQGFNLNFLFQILPGMVGSARKFSRGVSKRRRFTNTRWPPSASYTADRQIVGGTREQLIFRITRRYVQHPPLGTVSLKVGGLEFMAKYSGPTFSDTGGSRLSRIVAKCM